jgi:hypothetical protein
LPIAIALSTVLSLVMIISIYREGGIPAGCGRRRCGPHDPVRTWS